MLWVIVVHTWGGNPRISCHGRNLNIGNFSEAVKATAFKLSMMVSYLKVYVLIPVAVSSTLSQGHQKIKLLKVTLFCFECVLTEHFAFLLTT